MPVSSLDALFSALESALESGDEEALRALYLPTAVIGHDLGRERFESTPEEAAADRVRLGIPIRASLRRLDVDGDSVRGELVWAVEGVTPDGTELTLDGAAVLTCSDVGSAWYIASETVTCTQAAPFSSASPSPSARR
ncbi:hypothetical protein [Sinomonas humi]|uniref:SnoaL-like domain-containing protein n=1 Tax=Sinomonas humi TaxID=1338436 RepID=A0A0B2AIT6_9MICC|nr:hypothetical protein [Sinomonas humi]KHL01803.1 hypothetical protein LK10_14595 [Sinomonas humi]